jgi:hypothetical protein
VPAAEIQLEVSIARNVPADRTGFKTIADALEAVRALRHADRDSDVTISVVGGYYELASEISITSAEAPGPGWLNIVGDESGTTIISAGRRLNCRTIGAMSSCDMPQGVPDTLSATPRGNPAAGFYLASGERLMHPAAWPSASDERAAGTTWALFSRINDRTLRIAGDIRGLGGLDGKAVQLHLWPASDWYDQYIFASRTSDAAVFRLSRSPNYPLAEMGRVTIEGDFGLLREPGDWATRDGTIVGIPYTGERGPLVATHLSSALVLKDVRNVRLENLCFRHAQNALIDIVGGKSIEVIRNKFGPTGGQALEVRDSTDLVIRANEAAELAGGGFYVRGGDRRHLHSARIVLEANTIRRFSLGLRTYQPAIRLGGVGIRVESNDICESGHSGIIVEGNDHSVKRNHLCRLCLESSDCGAIYSGRDITYLGNSIVENVVEDVPGRALELRKGQLKSPANAVGVYLDDGVSGFRLVGNTLRRIGDIGIQIGGGSGNELLGNHIEGTPRPILIDSRWPEFAWDKNAVASIRSANPDWLEWHARYPALVLDHVSTEPERNVVAWNQIGNLGVGGPPPIISLDASETTNIFCENGITSGASRPQIYLHCSRRQKAVTVLDWGEWSGAQTCVLRAPEYCESPLQ